MTSLRLALCALLAASGLLASGSTTPEVRASAPYQRISGEGSSWSANFLDAMRVNVKQFGITVDFNPSGSTAGRKAFLNGTVDFAASDIPFVFRPEDGSAPENPAPGSYAYMPITAGGTAFMYNLKINGKQVTNLRLSGENVVKIFTGAITQWNDPALAADNPGLLLPAKKIVPVIRSDGSGATAQLTKWMIAKHGGLWQDFCQRSGRAPACGYTSFYPSISGFIAQSGDLGVTGYVSQGFAEGAIGYVNYSYALGVGFPVVKMLNDAGYYTEPTPQNVAVSLLQARVNTSDPNDPETYLTQELGGVYDDRDPRSYQLSSYSYLILPTTVGGQFNEQKGRTLSAFAYYAMCQGQQQSASLGYSPMPINLVQASFDQITKIPGAEVQTINIQSCKNPTFAPDGANLLAEQAPQPKPCDQQGGLQCPDGTAGAANIATEVLAGAQGGGDSGGGNTDGSGGSTGGSSGGSTSSGSGGSTSGGGSTTGGGGSTGSGTGAGVGAGTGAGTDSGTGTETGGTGTGADTAVDPSTCDPDLGNCDPALVADGGTGGQGGQQVAAGAIVPTTLSQSSGFGISLGLLLLVMVLTVGLVIAPVIAWRYFQGGPAQ
jgi:phosphate transport system substrate-binding protein